MGIFELTVVINISELQFYRIFENKDLKFIHNPSLQWILFIVFCVISFNLLTFHFMQCFMTFCFIFMLVISSHLQRFLILVVVTASNSSPNLNNTFPSIMFKRGRGGGKYSVCNRGILKGNSRMLDYFWYRCKDKTNIYI